MARWRAAVLADAHWKSTERAKKKSSFPCTQTWLIGIELARSLQVAAARRLLQAGQLLLHSPLHADMADWYRVGLLLAGFSDARVRCVQVSAPCWIFGCQGTLCASVTRTYESYCLADACSLFFCTKLKCK